MFGDAGTSGSRKTSMNIYHIVGLVLLNSTGFIFVQVSMQALTGSIGGRERRTHNFTHVAVPLVFGANGSAFGLSPVFWANTIFLAAGGYASRRRSPGPSA